MAEPTSGNVPPPSGNASLPPPGVGGNGGGNAPKTNGAPKTNNSPSTVGKALQLLGVIGLESGLGFGTGFMVGKKNVGGVVGSIIALSLVISGEFWVRYAGGKNVLVWLGGFLALAISAIVPYIPMLKAKKGKASAAAAPTMAGAWALVALIFGVACAKLGGKSIADALQGVILTLLYSGVTTAAGYAAAAQRANLPFALATFGALLVFDLAGLARAPAVAGQPSAAAAGA